MAPFLLAGTNWHTARYGVPENSTDYGKSTDHKCGGVDGAGLGTSPRSSREEADRAEPTSADLQHDRSQGKQAMSVSGETADEVEVIEEVPRVVQEKRRQDRQHFVSALLVLGAVIGCTYYLISKLDISPF